MTLRKHTKILVYLAFLSEKLAKSFLQKCAEGEDDSILYFLVGQTGTIVHVSCNESFSK
jgi:hypothetical protein